MGGRGMSSKVGGGDFSNSLVQDTLYHGTNVNNITSFSTSGRESNGAIFFADDPDYAEEEAYVKQESSGGEKTMYEVKLNIRNPMEVTLNGNEFGDPTRERKYIEAAKRAGNDSVIFHSNTGYDYMDQTFYAVFDAKQIKITGKKKI